MKVQVENILRRTTLVLDISRVPCVSGRISTSLEGPYYKVIYVVHIVDTYEESHIQAVIRVE